MTPMEESPPKRSTSIKVYMSAELRDAIRQAAAHDEQAEGAWLRIVAVAVLRKRGMWPPGQSST